VRYKNSNKKLQRRGETVRCSTYQTYFRYENENKNENDSFSFNKNHENEIKIKIISSYTNKKLNKN